MYTYECITVLVYNTCATHMFKCNISSTCGPLWLSPLDFPSPKANYCRLQSENFNYFESQGVPTNTDTNDHFCWVVHPEIKQKMINLPQRVNILLMGSFRQIKSLNWWNLHVWWSIYSTNFIRLSPVVTPMLSRLTIFSPQFSHFAIGPNDVMLRYLMLWYVMFMFNFYVTLSSASWSNAPFP